jgi:hypothetical protein
MYYGHDSITDDVIFDRSKDGMNEIEMIDDTVIFVAGRNEMVAEMEWVE